MTTGSVESRFPARALGLMLGASLAVHVVCLVLGQTILDGWRWSNVAVHASAEMSGATIALAAAFLLVSLRRRGEGVAHGVWIAGALIGMGVLDGLHALCDAGNTFVWLHSTATFVGGALFSLAWVPERFERRAGAWWHWAVLPATLWFGTASMAFPVLVPRMLSDGAFTWTAKALNVGGGILFFAGAVRLALTYRATRRIDDLLFCLHATLFGAAAVMFERSALWDLPWWGWHLLRLMAYAVALGFVVRSDQRAQDRMLAASAALRDARRDLERQVEERTAQLSEANATLETARRELELRVQERTRDLAAALDAEDDRARQLRGLAEAGLAFHGIPTIEGIVQAATEWARSLVGARQAVASFTSGRDWSQAITGLSLSDEYAAYRTYATPPDGSGIYAVVCETNQSMRLTQDELEAHPRWRAFGTEAERHPPMRGWLAAPLIAPDGSNLGLLQLGDRIRGEFTAEDEAILVQLAQLVSSAVVARRTQSDLEQRVDQRTAELRRESVLREQSDALRRAADERLDLALRSARIGTWDWDVGEDVVVWDRHLHPLFGLRPGTFPGTYAAFRELVHPDDRDRVDGEVRAAVHGTSDYDTEFRVVWPDGSEHAIAARGQVYRDPAGAPRRMTGVCWDVTERRRLEARFRAVVESSPTAIFMVDDDGRISLANPAATRVFGYEGDELLGRPIECLVPDRFRGTHLGLRSGYFADPRPRPMGRDRELPGLRKDGTEFPVEIGLSPMRIDDRTYVLAAVTDITERKRAHEALRRSNAELEQFAYVASHDLQEPLRKIQAFGDMLATSAGDSLGTEERDYLSRMCRAAARMRTLIDDLLDLSRVATRGRPFEPVDLTEVAREVLEDLEARLVESGAAVRVGDLPKVMADPTQMRQLLQNLVGNALKYRKPDVAPEILVERLDDCGPGQVAFAVRDNGIGFDPKHAERIFQPFQRLHGRGEYEGTGMGLAICRKIVERHEGTIVADARPGAGAVFRVVLPFRPFRPGAVDGESR